MRNIDEDSFIQEVEKRMREKDYPDKLYHYTSAEALFGIFTKQELWFSNPLMLNDREECFYFPRELKKALKESCPQSINRIETFFDSVFIEIEKEPFYIMCFSKLKDDAAQWDRYSNKGKGFCIEFDTKALLLLFGTKWIQLWPVCYDLEVHKHPLFEILKEYFSGNDQLLKKQLGNEDSAKEQVIMLSIAHKHPSFKAEQEYRLVFSHYTSLVKSLTGLKSNCYEEKYMPTNGVISHKCILKLSELFNFEKNVSFKDLITGIIVGPNSEQNMPTLKQYLESLKQGKEIRNISRSSCPLR